MRKTILIAAATLSVERLALFAFAENMFYIHQQANWPHFTWRQDSVVTLLAAVRHR